MTDLSAFLSDSVGSSGGTYRWMSPELLDPRSFCSKGRPTRESDCYALGMTIYEVRQLQSSRRSPTNASQVLTGLQPFYRMPSPTFIPAVVRGERPEKPSQAESLGFSDTLWELVRSCWSESRSTRPSALELLDCLSLVAPTWDPLRAAELGYPTIAADNHVATSSGSYSSLD